MALALEECAGVQCKEKVVDVYVMRRRYSKSSLRWRRRCDRRGLAWGLGCLFLPPVGKRL
jgi:hypothetical protein